ncbi:MAG: SpaA isopeptide-forming pilin-related protein [Bulleidia sp.]
MKNQYSFRWKIRKLYLLLLSILMMAGMFSCVPAMAENDVVNARVETGGETMNVYVSCSFVDHQGNPYTSFWGDEYPIVDVNTGSRMFCVEPGPIMEPGIHTSIGTLQTVYGKEKGDRLQLISWYGTRSGSRIDYYAAQSLIWEIAANASVTQRAANAAAINAAKAVIMDQVNRYLQSGKAVRGTSKVYRGGGQDIMSIGTLITDRDISITLQKQSSDNDIIQADASYSLQGAVYRVYEGNSTSGKHLCDLTTDSQGNASIQKVTVADETQYITIQEIQAPKGYALNSTPITQRIENNSFVSFHVSDVPQTKRVSVQITKESAIPQFTQNNPMYSLKDACFEVFYQTSDNQKVILGTIRTDENGTASASYDNIPLGVQKLQIQELSAPAGYYPGNDIYAEILHSDTAVFHVRDIPAYAEMEIEIEKKDADGLDVPMPLEGAQFTVSYYAGSIDTTPLRTWVIQTVNDENGRSTARLDQVYLVSGDPLYTTSDGKTVLPLGMITIEETKAPQGYLLDHVVVNGELQNVSEENGKIVCAVVQDSNMGAVILGSQKYIYHDQRASGGLKLQKHDTAYEGVQGDGRNLVSKWKITNCNDYDTAMKSNGTIVSIAKAGEAFDQLIVTDDNGYWESDADFLQVGSYRIEEVEAPVGYLVSSDQTDIAVSRDFTIADHGEMVDMTIGLKDEIMRGGFVLRKNDAETTQAQGDADLRAMFVLINRSEHPVVVNGQIVEKDGIVDVDGDHNAWFETDAFGMYTTSDDLLPYGTYEIREIQAPAGYLLSKDSVCTFTIRQDHAMADLTACMQDEVVTGTFSLYKHVNAQISSEWDDHPEQGAVFLAILKSKLKQLFDGDIFAAYEALKENKAERSVTGLSLKEFSIVVTDENGLGTSGQLAYGTYVIGQVASDPDYALIPDMMEFHVTGKTETAVNAYGIPVVINSDQPNVVFSATNDALTYQLRIVKKDADTGKRVVRNGASFMIGYDSNDNGVFDEQDRQYSHQMINGVRVINGYVTMPVANRKYDVFRTCTTAHQNVLPGTFVPDETIEGNAGMTITPLQVEKGTYFIFEQDRDDSHFHEVPAGYVQAGSQTVVIGGAQFTGSDDHYTILHDGENGFFENLYVVTCEMNNERAYGTLNIVKTIAETESDTSLIDRSDFSGFGFTLYAQDDILDPSDGTVIAKAGKKAKIMHEGRYETVQEITLHQDGTAVLENIPLGTYVLKETRIPAGFVRKQTEYSVVFAQPEDDRTTKVFEITQNVVNTPIRTEISKISITDEKELPGASMRITDEKGNTVDTWISEDRPHVIEGLHAGTTCFLHEDLAPPGYVRASSVPFTVKDNGEVNTVKMVDRIVQVVKSDVRMKAVEGAKMRIIDEDGNVLDSWTSGKQPHEANGLQEGMTYILQETEAPSGYVKAEDIVFTVQREGEIQLEMMVDLKVTAVKTNTKGTLVEGAFLQVLDMEGNVVDEWTSQKRSHNVEHLVEGRSYVLHEEKAPDGYVRAEDLVFTVNNSGENIRLKMVDTTVTVEKKDDNGKPLSGALLCVMDENGESLDTWTSDGTAHMVNGLEHGRTYTLHEQKAPDGYHISDDIVFTTDHDRKITMNDEMTEVKLLKTDEDGIPVQGVHLRLYDQTAGTEVRLDNDGVTTENMFVLKGILIGGHTYQLVEESWVEGVHPSASMIFTVPYEKPASPMVIAMVDLKTAVSFIKTDDAGNPVAGAGMELIPAYRNEDGQIVPETEGNNTVHTFVSGTEPVDLSMFVKGQQCYILRETDVPDGYEKAEETAFEVTGTQDIPQAVVMCDTRKTYTIEVVKKDRENGEVLEGASLGLYDSDGNVVLDVDGNPCIAETDETGTVSWQVLYDPKGYDLKELHAPNGYVNENLCMHVDPVEQSDEDNVIFINVENTRIPDTGVRNDMRIPAGIFAVSLIAAGAMVLLKNLLR